MLIEPARRGWLVFYTDLRTTHLILYFGFQRMTKGSIHITKSDGSIVIFDPEKLTNSLMRSGASQEVAAEILQQIEGHVHEGTSTKEIYKEAYRLLRKKSKAVAGRYKLKKAITELGPSGYPFENFVGAILQSRGYEVKVGEMVEGKCGVRHEVDVVAENDHDHFMVECKFHTDPLRKSTIQVPLYIHSRFEDIFSLYRHLPGYKTKLHQSWIVTNTKFTEDARKYAKCVGLNLISWDYPKGNSLKNWIDYSGLHPITSLQSINKNQKRQLLDAGLVLCRDIQDKKEAVHALGLSNRQLTKLREEASGICQQKEV